MPPHPEGEILRCLECTHAFTRQSLAHLFGSRNCQVNEHWDHHAPIEAMDLPVTSRAANVVLRGGLWLLWGTGRAMQASYLQTVVCREVRSPTGKPLRVSEPAQAIGQV